MPLCNGRIITASKPLIKKENFRIKNDIMTMAQWRWRWALSCDTLLSTNGTRFLIYELGQNMKWISALAHTRWSTGLISSLISLPMRRRDLKNMDIAFHQIDKSEILHSNNIFKTINISFINSLERKWKYEYIIIFLFVLVVHNYYESSHFCCKHVPTKRFHQVHRPIHKKRNDRIFERKFCTYLFY